MKKVTMINALVLAALVLLLGPLVAQAQLVVGSRVQTSLAAAVRDVPGGTSLGLQPVGATGTVIAGPGTAWGIGWWQVDYDTGPDGWSSDDRLIAVAGPPPGQPSAPQVTRRDVDIWTLRWDPKPQPPGTQYEIERSVGAMGAFSRLATVAATTVLYNDRAVTVGLSYCYRLRARTVAEVTGYSNVGCTP